MALLPMTYKSHNAHARPFKMRTKARECELAPSMMCTVPRLCLSPTPEHQYSHDIHTKRNPQQKLTDLRSSMPARITELDAVLHSAPFGKSIAEIMAQSRASVASNPEVAGSLGVARDVLLRTVEDLGLVCTWLKLKVPKVSDGGNFGVAVVLEVVKTIEQKLDGLNKALDDLPSYFSERAGAVDKVVARTSTDIKESKSKSSSTGGKDGDETKGSESQSEEKSTKKNEALPDQLEHVVALDAKFFTIFKRDVELCQSAYLTCFDILEKNYTLLNAPRGDKGDSSHLSMF